VRGAIISIPLPHLINLKYTIMKTLLYYLPYLPLYLITLAGLILIIKSFVKMFVRTKVKSIDIAIVLDESENNKLYKTFKA